ncbi:MAG: 23S rRNA (adenine(2503)-C(2))-methyltransferase RlmN [Calditrichota bacterium]
MSMTNQEKTPLIGLTIEQLLDELKPMGVKKFRATQIYQWLHHHKAHSFDEMTNLSKEMRAELDARYRFGTLKLALRQESTDGTRKYLWALEDGKQIESVFIPEETRNTICISSQVGCALGCTFCATAQMGFLRNLTPGEIVEQVVKVQQDNNARITNVVFMGMGEPFLNYPRVIQAANIMSDPHGLAIAAKKITISTVGIVPRIRQYADEGHKFSLAISLHSAIQNKRLEIMPVAKKFSLDELMDSAHYYSKKLNKRVFFEYVLLEGINDRGIHGKALKSLLGQLKCKLNLIPYNNTGIGYKASGDKSLESFLAELATAPFMVTFRKNRGTDIAAACGQLFIESDEKARSLGLPQPQAAD